MVSVFVSGFVFAEQLLLTLSSEVFGPELIHTRQIVRVTSLYMGGEFAALFGSVLKSDHMKCVETKKGWKPHRYQKLEIGNSHRAVPRPCWLHQIRVMNLHIYFFSMCMYLSGELDVICKDMGLRPKRF